jgi:NADH:ubiquinone oxidoreductase subunit 3 (subunit A)
MIFEYTNIFICIFVIFIIATIIFALSFSLIIKNSSIEKNSSYECGFDPFEDTRNTFNIQFYLVGILFIIFDLEIIFLFPWITVINKIDFFGFWSMIFFLILLTVGFIFEWKKGAIDWQ